ncbi:MAG: type II toxin-antitoxin system RelE/ParE family toxin [Lachnospiraceae bacterium]|nr:type II toxin-antitoxin system RelE/ParE family toxin [Lachnospiraceae bacterium]
MLNETHELRYLPLFYEELDERVSYIAFNLENPVAANNLMDDVESAILKRLEEGPSIFEPVPSQKNRVPYYRIYVKNYVIYYVVLEENGKKIMEVRRFLHTLEDRDHKI